MQRLIIIGGVVAAALIVILANAFYIVSLDQQAIVLRFGQYQYAVNADGSQRGAGLHFKVPVIENVIYYDKRNMGFDLDSAEIIAADQQRLNVDAIARWRIKDPTQFFRAATSMENGLAQLRQGLAAGHHLRPARQCDAAYQDVPSVEHDDSRHRDHRRPHPSGRPA